MPDNVINALSLEIKAQAQGANQVLDGLTTRLERLGIVLKNFTKRKVNIGVDNAQVDVLRKFANAIEDLNFSKLNAYANLTQQIQKITIGLKADDGNNLSMFAMGLEDLDIEKFREYAEITKNVSKISTGLNAPSSDAFVTFVDAVNRLSTDKAMAFADAFRNFGGVHLGFSDKGVESLAGFVVAMNMADTDRMSEFAKIFSAFEGVHTGLTEKSASAFKNFAEASAQLDIEKLRELTTLDFSNIDSLANSAKHFSINFGTIEKTTNKVTANFNEITKTTASMSRETRKASHSFSFASTAIGKFVKSIGRIAFYRAIRTALKSVTQGFQEGIQNLYYWSQAWGTSFAPKMDQLATAQQYLKNGFASMFSPLIEYAIPIIDRMIDKFVEFFNFVQEGFARLTGAPTWNKALKYPVQYADALDDATGSAKALKNQLLGFDELNVLNTPTDSSRGRSGDEKDYSAMFKLMQTETSGSPFGWLGEIVSDIAGKIEKAFGIVQKFALFVKGLNFEPLKNSLSGLWDGVLSPIIDDLLDDADWIEQHVLEPITQFLVEKGIPTAIDTLSSAIDNCWKIIKPIKDGLKTLWDDTAELRAYIGGKLITHLEKLRETFDKIGAWFNKNSRVTKFFASLGSVAKKLTPLFKAIGDVVDSGAWESFGTTLNMILDVLDPILDSLTGVLELLDGIMSFDLEKIEKGLEDIGTSILKSMCAPLTGFIDLLAEAFEKLADFAYAHGWTVIGDNCSETARGFRQGAAELRTWGDTAAKNEYKFTEMYNGIEKGNRGAGVQFDSTAKKANEGWKSIQATGSASAIASYKAWLSANGYIINSFGEVVKAAGTAGTNIGKQISANAQAALNMSPLQVTATINTRINSVNVNDKWRAALAAAGVPITGFASGGFPAPESASLFWAGEGGVPEMLGTVGGRTAVAGGAEITGIREAILGQQETESQLLRQLIAAVNAKDLTLTANSSAGRWVSKSLRAYQGVTG